MMHDKTLVVLCGPTAVGKTKSAIALAQHFKSVIISADSRQFYKELVIGTAAPTPDELALAKHYLTGHLSIHDYYNVSMYESDALQIINNEFKHRNIVIAAGGSGLYLDVLCHGIDNLPDVNFPLRKELAGKLQENGLTWLQEEVKKYDPAYYAETDSNNHKRLLRALEIIHITGKRYSDLRVRELQPRPFKIIKTGLFREREILFNRIEKRTDQMLAQGLEKECRALYPYRHLNALNTVGYKEMFHYFEGTYNLDQAIEKIKVNTRRYAKRQLTWFKRDAAITWFHPDDTEKIISHIKKREHE